MSDNTVQFGWIVLLKENLECLFVDNPDVFVAGDLSWYPVEGHPEIKLAPDVMVAMGRPKGHRGSYRQWEEANIVPQVVIEILSPGNTIKEMAKKQQFYDRYGVEEYYLYDPKDNDLTVLCRREGRLEVIDTSDWQSPRLGIRFLLTTETLEVYYPDGKVFLTTVELAAVAKGETARADLEAARADLESAKAREEAARADREATRADRESAKALEETARADRESARAEALVARLRALGIDLDDRLLEIDKGSAD